MSRRIVILMAGVVLLAVLWSGYWYWLAATAERQIADLAGANRQPLQLQVHDLRVSGFPATLHLTLDDPRLRVADGPAWAADRLEARLNPLRPDRLRLLLPAEVTSRPPGGPAVELRLGGAGLDLMLLAQDRRGRLTADSLTLAADGRSVLQLDAVVVETTWSAEAASLSAASAGLALAEATLPAGIAAEFADVALQLSLPAPFPTSSDVAGLVAWRDAGGTLEIQALRFDWRALTVGLEATLALDQGLRPLGAGTLRLHNVDAALDALRQAGLLGDDEARRWRIILSALPRSDIDGKSFVELPLAAQDGILYVGPFPVARLPSVVGR